MSEFSSQWRSRGGKLSNLPAHRGGGYLLTTSISRLCMKTCCEWGWRRKWGERRQLSSNLSQVAKSNIIGDVTLRANMQISSKAFLFSTHTHSLRRKHQVSTVWQSFQGLVKRLGWESACCQAWWLECNPQGAHGAREKNNSCQWASDLHMYVTTCADAFVHIGTHKYIKVTKCFLKYITGVPQNNWAVTVAKTFKGKERLENSTA